MLSETISHKAGKILLQTLFFFFITTQICLAQWYQQNSGTTKNLHAVHFIDANNGWVVGDSGTILKTTDLGNSWNTQPSGIIQNLNDTQFINANEGWAVGDSGKILWTINGGTNWTQQISGTFASLTAIFFLDENNGWIIGETIYDSLANGFSTIIKTTDGGTNWDDISVPYSVSFISDVYFVNINTGFIVGGDWEIIYGANGIILKTTDGGDTWSDQAIPGSSFWRGIAFSDELNGIVVGGRRSSIGPPWGSILRTTDGGTNWLFAYEEELPGSFNEWGYFVNVELFDSNYVWVIGGGDDGSKTFFSSDTGLTWTSQIDSGLYPNFLYGVCFINSSTGWAVGQNGIILNTTNGGVPVDLTSFTATSKGNKVILNWSTATETNNSGFSIERKSSGSEYSEIGFVPGFGTTTEPKTYSYTDSEVSAGKYTYRLKQIDFDGSYEYSQEVEVEVSVPLEFTIEQNYPNPFNPSTKISWQLPKASRVTLKIFNSLGEELSDLVDNEYQDVGEHSTLFIVNSSLPSGVYFYQLKAGEYSAVKKMLLIK